MKFSNISYKLLEKLVEIKKKKSLIILLQAEQSLPKEPAETESNISKIRVRKPTGDFLERRFYANNTLQVSIFKFLIETL